MKKLLFIPLIILSGCSTVEEEKTFLDSCFNYEMLDFEIGMTLEQFEIKFSDYLDGSCSPNIVLHLAEENTVIYNRYNKGGCYSFTFENNELKKVENVKGTNCRGS